MVYGLWFMVYDSGCRVPGSRAYLEVLAQKVGVAPGDGGT